MNLLTLLFFLYQKTNQLVAHLSRCLLTIIIFMQQSKCCSCMHMAPFVTFRRGDWQSLHHTDIQQHGLHVMIGSLSLALSFLPPAPSFFSFWAFRELVQAAAATALLSDCHSSISLPLSAHGVQLTTHDPQSQTASPSPAREPSS